MFANKQFYGEQFEYEQLTGKDGNVEKKEERSDRRYTVRI